MDIKPIRTEADYEVALGRVEALMDAEHGSPEGDELDVLVTLIEAYEQERHAIGAPDPVEFIKNAMEFMGVGQAGLAEVLNSRSRASEILNRRRPLTLEHIRKIAFRLHLPADPLIGKYDVRQ